MKKITISLLVGLLAFVTANAQMKEGKIVYERKINMWKMITDPEMRTRIPEFRTSEFELLFNDQASLFRNVPEDEAPDPFANSGGGGGERGGMRFAFRMPETTTYTNIATQMQYESRPMFEKVFLVVDSLKPLKWKISEETKTIAKHVCKKATTMITAQNVRIGGGGGGARGFGRNNGDTANRPSAAITPKETEVVVWYTEDIAASVGPDNYSGLPGAILEVDVDNGSNVTTATEVTSKYPKKELVEPTKGDKMNRAQFQDAMKKLMEDMQRGGGMGGMRIRVNNN
jgi:GLPGLI family protein